MATELSNARTPSNCSKTVFRRHPRPVDRVHFDPHRCVRAAGTTCHDPHLPSPRPLPADCGPSVVRRWGIVDGADGLNRPLYPRDATRSNRLIPLRGTIFSVSGCSSGGYRSVASPKAGEAIRIRVEALQHGILRSIPVSGTTWSTVHRSVGRRGVGPRRLSGRRGSASRPRPPRVAVTSGGTVIVALVCGRGVPGLAGTRTRTRPSSVSATTCSPGWSGPSG